MASHDYFMRQIEGITDMLAVALFSRTSEPEEAVYEMQTSAQDHTLLIDLRFWIDQGRIDQAENLLFEALERDRSLLEPVRQFYRWLEDLNDETLGQGGFSREEIREGLEAAETLCREGKE